MIFLLAYLYVHHLVLLPMVCIRVQNLWIHFKLG